MKKGIFVAGAMIADLRCVVDMYPKIGNLTQITEKKLTTGGINNILIDLAKLDCELKLTVAGVIGEDDAGRLIEKEISEYSNIKNNLIKVEGNTALTYVFTESTSKLRTFFFDVGVSKCFSENHLDFDKMSCDIFHLEYLSILGHLDEKDEEYGTKTAKLLKTIQDKGIKTSIDVVSEESDRFREIVIPSLKYTDYCIINEVELGTITSTNLTDANDELVLEALYKVRSFGVSTWIIMHSPLVSYGLDENNNFVKLKSATLPKGFIKGTTGAGDAYCAGVLHGAYKGYDIETSMKQGMAVAICCLSEEDNSGIMSIEECIKFSETII